MALFKNAAKDAKKIQDSIDYRVLKAAWDSYTHIHKGNFKARFKTSTPAWYALFAIQNYNGNFKKFDSDEIHLLESLTDIHGAYDEIITSLQDNSQDTELAEYIIRTHPNLSEAIPRDYLYVDKVGAYIAGEIKRYQTLLLNFYEKYQKKIDQAISSN